MNIVLAEDNADHAELTTFVLLQVLPGSTVTRVTNGEELLALAKAQSQAHRVPELLILDIKMPRMNGHEVLDEIKGDPVLSPLPVLVITTSSDDRDRRACLALGASCYLVKPITRSALVPCLENLGLLRSASDNGADRKL